MDWSDVAEVKAGEQKINKKFYDLKHPFFEHFEQKTEIDTYVGQTWMIVFPRIHLYAWINLFLVLKW